MWPASVNRRECAPNKKNYEQICPGSCWWHKLAMFEKKKKASCNKTLELSVVGPKRPDQCKHIVYFNCMETEEDIYFFFDSVLYCWLKGVHMLVLKDFSHQQAQSNHICDCRRLLVPFRPNLWCPPERVRLQILEDLAIGNEWSCVISLFSVYCVCRRFHWNIGFSWGVFLYLSGFVTFFFQCLCGIVTFLFSLHYTVQDLFCWNTVCVTTCTILPVFNSSTRQLLVVVKTVVTVIFILAPKDVRITENK